jgi:hypothetical protein
MKLAAMNLATMKRLRTLSAALLAFVIAFPAWAHVGNKDVFQTIKAGPYTLFVTVRTPTVIPGVATIEVRSTGAAISGLTITPLLLTGEASKHPPTPDAMQVSSADPAFYTGSLWLMGAGSWQVRFGITGAAGSATASVPVVAAPIAVLTMQRPLGLALAALGLLLVVGFVGIVRAAVGEARLAPGAQPDPKRRRRAVFASAAALVFAVFAIALGGWWWHVEAADYASELFRAADLRPTLQGSTLILSTGQIVKGQPYDGHALGEWDPTPNARLLLDHGKPMHLYAIRWPQMDAVYHLHPATTGKFGLSETLPNMPPGEYKLYADVVYLSGFAETMTATMNVPPGLSTSPLAADDASAAPPPLSAGELGTSYKLPDGFTMVWDKPATITATTPYGFRFTLLDPTGKPAQDMQPYLGMAGHAAFVKTDGSTFAHTHPDGSAAMPAVMLADASSLASSGASSGAAGGSSSMDAMNGSDIIGPTVTFPYGFPAPGRYRIFIQMKHGSTVETGVFDTEVQ